MLLPFFLTMLIIPLAYLDPGTMGMVDIDKATKMSTDMPRLPYLYTQFSVILTYIRLLFLPINLNLDYDQPLYSMIFKTQVFLSFLLLAAILVLGIVLYWKSKTGSKPLRILSFGIAWFFLTLSVESSVLPISEYIFEYRAYLPSVGFILAIVVFLFSVFDAGRYGKRATYALLTVALLFSCASHERNFIWKDEITLWKDASNKSPSKGRAHNNLGLAYQREGKYDSAEKSFRKVLSIDPTFQDAWINLGVLHESQGMYKEAEREFLTIVSAAPGYARAHYNLGVVYAKTGRLDKAMKQYIMVVSLMPDYADAHNNLGSLYIRKGLYQEALKEFQTAASLDPLNEGFRRNLWFARDTLKER